MEPEPDPDYLDEYEKDWRDAINQDLTNMTDDRAEMLLENYHRTWRRRESARIMEVIKMEFNDE